MGLQELKDEIVQEAKEKAKVVETEALEEAKLDELKAKEEAQAIRRKADEELAMEKQELMRRELAAARFSQKRQLQEAKSRLLGSCFAEASAQLSRMPDRQRSEIMRLLIDRAKGNLAVAKVYCNAKDQKYVEGFPSQAMDIMGGLIAEDREGKVRLDFSFETLLQAVRENSSETIGAVLFR
ncbi:MAG: hypothetical protein V1735_00155 [Nanoarchaeota archaeon]